MSFRTIEIKSCYESGKDNLIDDFYIRVLRESISYDRIAGFFSSTSLAVAARGILSLTKNNGRMRIIASPRFSAEDIEVINKCAVPRDEVVRKILHNEIENLENSFERDHLFALSWMLKNELLEIKVAFVQDNVGSLLTSNQIKERGLFHQKVGLLKDIEGNLISFSGSINESASGWINNIEEFKVFKDWEIGQNEFCISDNEKFNSFWNNLRPNVVTTNIDDAIKNELIDKSPTDIDDLLSEKKYWNWRRSMDNSSNKLSLFDYQKEAVDKWQENSKRLICEMATGTGKTRTALGCIERVLIEGEPITVVIATPQNTLSRQWAEEIQKTSIRFEYEIFADSTNLKWRTNLTNKLQDLSLGSLNNLVVYTTHDTCSSADFIRVLGKNKRKTKFFFIGDEAHSLGAHKTSNALQNFYDYRLGLSATPRRWYDDEGTKSIYKFFGEESFEFSIKQALTIINPLTNKPFLCPYHYFPVFISLEEDELCEYAELTRKITQMANYGKDSDQYQKIFENLLFRRANIHKTARNKLKAFESIINSMTCVEDLLVFVSPNQMDSILQILSKMGIVAHKFTEKEGTVLENKYNGRSERQFLIDKFKQGQIKALVAIKCLDEGIDIPSAKKAIIIASSTNPREYIQRIGRVIRQSPEKTNAEIYDLIVKPDKSRKNDILWEFETKVFNSEMKRVLEIAENAVNNAVATNQVFSILKGEINEH